MLKPAAMRTKFCKIMFCWGIAIGWCTATAQAQLNPPAMSADEETGRLRVMHVGLVAADVLAVALRAGRIEHGSQQPYEKLVGDEIRREGHQRWLYRSGRWVGSLVGRDERTYMPADRYVGDRLDADWAAQPVSFQLASTDDPRCQPFVQPERVWRKTKPCDIGRVGPRHPWEFDCPTESVIYLELPFALAKGGNYELRFQGSSLPPVTLAMDAARLRSEAVHVSHIGFHPADPAKVAFLSCWRGSGGPQHYPDGLHFAVVRTTDGKAVAQGRTRLSKAAADKTEDALKRNYNGTDVFELDFSQVQNLANTWWPSREWAVLIPFRLPSESGEMRSPFPQGVSTTSAAASRSARPTLGSCDREPFHPDDGVVVRASTCPLLNSGNGLNYWGTDKDNFGNLVKGRTDSVVPDSWGGYMDAGDWDRRIQHLVVSRYLLELADTFPETWRGVKLNIPESGSGLPDIVSEALFNLDCYRRMQTADGGIRGGIESSEHPREGEGSWQESLEVLAYAPDVWSSHWYAGVAARAALVLREIRPDLSQVYRDSALRAMEFAEQHWAELGEPKPADGGVIDQRNMAAAELFRLTGEERWHRVFVATTVFRDRKALLFEWPKHNQRDNAWVYARTSHANVDAGLQANCRQAILAEADARGGLPAHRVPLDQVRMAAADVRCIHATRRCQPGPRTRFDRRREVPAGADPGLPARPGRQPGESLLHDRTRPRVPPAPPAHRLGRHAPIAAAGPDRVRSHRLRRRQGRVGAGTGQPAPVPRIREVADVGSLLGCLLVPSDERVYCPEPHGRDGVRVGLSGSCFTPVTRLNPVVLGDLQGALMNQSLKEPS